MCGDGFIRVRMATSNKASVRENVVSSPENMLRRRSGGTYPSRPDKYYSMRLRRQYRHISRSLDNIDMQFYIVSAVQDWDRRIGQQTPCEDRRSKRGPAERARLNYPRDKHQPPILPHPPSCTSEAFPIPAPPRPFLIVDPTPW